MSELEMIIQKYLSKEGAAITYSDFDQQEVNMDCQHFFRQFL